MTTKAQEKMQKKIKVFKTLDDMSQFAADKFITIGNRSIKKNGRFTVALSGGTTPKSLYHLLTTDEYKTKIDWEKVLFFFSDERDVSPMSEKSNFRMANETMLKPLKISGKNIFRWQTEIINAPEVAESYGRSIVKVFELSTGEFPNFDLILLGMGDDGHTASLFPYTSALKETDKLVTANYVEKLDTNRLTFTYPTINNASNIIFMVCGVEKSNALKEVLEGEHNCEKFPSQCIDAKNGNLLWLIDKEASELLG